MFDAPAVTIQLPEPALDGAGTPHWTVEDGSFQGGTVTIEDGQITHTLPGVLRDPAAARSAGRALTAAAEWLDSQNP